MDGNNNDYLAINLSKQRLGRCNDSNWEIHGVPDSCTIIADSFTDLLERLVMNKGKSWYGLQENGSKY